MTQSDTSASTVSLLKDNYYLKLANLQEEEDSDDDEPAFTGQIMNDEDYNFMISNLDTEGYAEQLDAFMIVDHVTDASSEKSLDLSVFDKADLVGSLWSKKGSKPLRVEAPVGACPPGRRQFQTFPDIPESKWKSLVFSGRTVHLSNSKGGLLLVGIVPKENPDELVAKVVMLADVDPLDIAMRFSEEVGGKGQRGGFSMLAHATACHLLLASTDGILEPSEGHDVTLTDGPIRVEMTGMSFEKRLTSAQCCINKYLLLLGACSHTPELLAVLGKSFKEDIGDTSGFKNTGFEQSDTSMTPMVDRMHNSLRLLTDSQLAGLSSLVKRYHYETPAPLSKPRPTEFNIPWIKEQIAFGSKLGKFPCLLRVTFFQEDIDETELEFRQAYHPTEIDWDTMKTRFSYHTLDSIEEVGYGLQLRNMNKLKPEIHQPSLSQITYSYLCQFDFYQSLLIEQELFNKIENSYGNFYSKYSNTGISWRKGKNKYTCFFYQRRSLFNEKLEGKWYEDKDGFYQSPRFKITAQDIAYSMCLPGRVATSVQACWSLIPLTSLQETITKLMPAYATWHNSTWQTSRLAANTRHIVPCFLAKSGDLPNLVEDSFKFGRCKFFRSCDAIIAKALLDLAINEETMNHNSTPLFGLPVNLMHLESDLPIPMYWHIREGDHDDNSPVKLIEGQKLERSQRPIRDAWLRLQADFLETLILEGVSQAQFNSLMAAAPDFPSLNFPYWIGLTNLAQEKLKKVGDRQHPSKFHLKQLISDHYCHKIEDIEGITTTSSAKVADEFNSYAKHYQPKCAHDLMMKLETRNNPQVFKLFSKDSKSSDREIPVMTFPMRVIQNFSESMLEAFNYEVESDLVMDPKKHTIVGNEIMTRINNKHTDALISSQDKKFFSGYLFPELMSLCIATVARLCRSTAMVGSAAALRVMKTRSVILPDGFSNESLLRGLSGVSVSNIRRRDKLIRMFTILCEQHMMQGVGAAAGATINTSYYLGMTEMQTQMLSFVEDLAVYTTSDDTISMSRIKKGFDFDAARSEVIMVPIQHLKHAMMVNSDKKQVDSSKFGEFNNKVTFANGVMPVSPIYSALNCQPLNQASPMADLISAIGNARAGIFWGISIDACQMSLGHNIMQWQMKWLIKQNEINIVYNLGLVPTTAEELIEGFFPRTLQGLAACYNAVPEESRSELAQGTLSIANALSAMRIRQKKEHHNKLDYTGFVGVEVTLEAIDASRNMGQRLNNRFVKIKSIGTRIKFKNLLFSALSNQTADRVELDKINSTLRPLRARIVFRHATTRTTWPSTMGMSTRVDNVSTLRISALRGYSLRYRTDCNAEERLIAGLSDEEYKVWLKRHNLINLYKGLSFTCPFGLPLVRSCDNQVFTNPTCYNFYFDLDAKVPQMGVEVFDGIVVQDFQPCIWGTNSLTQTRDYLAYGHGILDGERYMFFQKKGKKVKLAHNPVSQGKTVKITRAKYENKDVACLNIPDISPILTNQLRIENFRPELAGLHGDMNAILNYGGWIKSNHPRGFATYQTVFQNRKCEMPATVINHMSNFPFFAANPTIIERGNATILEGSNCIARLKLVQPAQRAMCDVTINLSGSTPFVTTHIDLEDEFEFGLN